ncbi:hypothetical protein RAS1_15640 [Phycisphaerae bacterium RAS1]|nr:hypothetical protein RAS1_15640 [Phycisphaerae bacterium RAS1]
MASPAKPLIQQRTFEFAVRVLRVVRAMPRGVADQVIARQLARCGTSIGANVEEAQGAQSKAEFTRKMNIARGEAREAVYWLRLVAELDMVPQERSANLFQEAREISNILIAIVKTARSRPEG